MADRPHAAAGVLALTLLLGGCSSGLFSADRVDYRSAATKMNPLEVPPDLQQLSREGRYQQQRGTISASALPAAGAGTVRTSTAAVAPTELGNFRIEKDGNRRWLDVPLPPEQVWPQLGGFWRDMGFTLLKNDAAAGVMETNWAENRAKLPQDAIRKSLGTVLDTLYSTGELDQYRTRVERSASGGSEIIITHRGMVEVYTNAQKEFTKWEPRPSEPELENEMLSRLLVKLGATEAAARDAVANPAQASSAPAAPRARVYAAQPATLQVDDGLDRAWRRVGIALDRSGFSVEDRDRAAGLYFVRYVDPTTAGQETSPGFFAKIFGAKTDTSAPAVKYQIALKSDGAKTLVSVLDAQGAPVANENSQRIVALLVEDLQ